MKESQLQTRVNKYLQYAYKGNMFVFELKISPTTSNRRIPFSNIKPHQENALLSAKHYGFPYKIPDVGIMQKPFDAAYFKCPAYIALGFYSSNKKVPVYFIDIDKWLYFKTKHKSRSVSEDEVKDIVDFKLEV